jgi:hypothetical protein
MVPLEERGRVDERGNGGNTQQVADTGHGANSCYPASVVNLSSSHGGLTESPTPDGRTLSTPGDATTSVSSGHRVICGEQKHQVIEVSTIDSSPRRPPPPTNPRVVEDGKGRHGTLPPSRSVFRDNTISNLLELRPAAGRPHSSRLDTGEESGGVGPMVRKFEEATGNSKSKRTNPRAEFHGANTLPKTPFKRQGLATCLRAVLGLRSGDEPLSRDRFRRINPMETQRASLSDFAGDWGSTETADSLSVTSSTNNLWFIYGAKMEWQMVPGWEVIEEAYDVRDWLGGCIEKHFPDRIYVDKRGVRTNIDFANDPSDKSTDHPSDKSNTGDIDVANDRKFLVNIDVSLGEASIPLAFSGNDLILFVAKMNVEDLFVADIHERTVLHLGQGTWEEKLLRLKNNAFYRDNNIEHPSDIHLYFPKYCNLYSEPLPASSTR